MYYATSKFRKMMLDYMRTGRDEYFELQIVNQDPTSNSGSQTVVLKGVNLNGVSIAGFSAESSAMAESLSFTFSSAESSEALIK